jgi:PemK-like, MazF-like toxin of type II toxin-antitoxin system
VRYYADPDVGDIVWCLFPEQMGVPGPKPRPALVTGVNPNNGKPVVTVAYGTTQKLDKIYPTEFTINKVDGAAFALSGLSYETKFDLENSVVLPYCSKWFTPPPHAPHGQLPQLGTLHAKILPRVIAAYKNIK